MEYGFRLRAIAFWSGCLLVAFGSLLLAPSSPALAQASNRSDAKPVGDAVSPALPESRPSTTNVGVPAGNGGVAPPSVPAPDSDSASSGDKGVVASVKRAYREVVEPPASSADKRSPEERTRNSEELELGDTVTVEIDGLEALLAEEARTKKKIVLFLDDRQLEGLTAHSLSREESILRFELRRTDNAREAWDALLGKPGWGLRQTRISVGLSGEAAIPSAQYVDLRVIPVGWFVFWAALFAILLVLFLKLAVSSDLLRDPVPVYGTTDRRPFSLARTQVAMWFFLVLASYLLIGMVTGDFSSSITETVLGLLGISTGTAVFSAYIDANDKGLPDRRRNGLLSKDTWTLLNQTDDEIVKLESDLRARPAEETVKVALADSKSKRKALLETLGDVIPASRGFLQDILSDANGVTFHRFQVFAWTVVLGIVFVAQVYEKLAMPIFNSSLLALLGISAGAYLGMKIPEAADAPASDRGTS